MQRPKTPTIPLVKVTATGNDFVLVDLLRHGPEWLAGPATAHPRSQWVRAFCDRHFGIGADGAVFIEPHPEHAFVWDFYNSDGSSAEMCGNAARAVSLYYSQQTAVSKFSFLSKTGVVHAEVLATDDVEVQLSPITESAWNQWSNNHVDNLQFEFVRAGVPHAVLNVLDVQDRERLRALALEIKREQRFKNEGTNVTFMHVVSPGVIESVTFERGVEDFTLSCGTGAVAAAYAYRRGEQNQPVEVRVPGGVLNVNTVNTRPHLRGPARIIAAINWNL